MYRQRTEVRGGGANYSTELAGRDRFKFFRPPVEPCGGELHSGEEPTASAGNGHEGKRAGGTWNAAQIHYAASTPAAPSLMFSGTSSNIPFNPHAEAQHRPASVQGRHRANNHRGGGNGTNKRARMHHLPTLPGGTATSKFASTMPSLASHRQIGDEEAAYCSATARSHGVQTVYRENDVQTDPYSPDYYIPDGIPEPEILKLQGLTFQNGGLPAGKEEVELVQRLRRRREIEAALPQGNDDASIEERFRKLHALEEEEWRDRETHVEHLQGRRLDRIKASLMEREAAREEANKERLANVKQQYLSKLSHRLSSLHTKNMGDRRRATEKRIARNKAGGVDDSSEGGGKEGGGGSQRSAAGVKQDLIASYVNYGPRAAPPVISGRPGPGQTGTASGAGDTTKSMTYDVRPVLLTVVEGVEEVDRRRAGRIEHVSESAFAVPENEAIARLPTLYQRHEAERLVQSLERAHNQIQRSKLPASAAAAAARAGSDAFLSIQLEGAGTGTGTGMGTGTEGGSLMQIVSEEINIAKARSVLDLYRAPPKVQRPATPQLELDGDAEEANEEACILLQRLLRGRAVQNDFFEGKERCRGLIQELQAASDAKEAEQAVADIKALEALAAMQSNMVDDVISAAVGDIVGDTLGYLYQELDRQRDVQSLEELRAEAESVRKSREATELARREAERIRRDKEELQYAALVRATRHNVTAFLEAARANAVRDTALAVAVEAERARQGALPAPRDPTDEDEMGKENLVCDMLDGFVIPAIVDSIQLQERKVTKEAPAGAARDVAKEVVSGVDRESGSPSD